MSSSFDTVFSNLPPELREPLETHFQEIKNNFARARFEPAELNGGKFCEIVLRILEWHTEGTYTTLGKTVDFAQVTKRLENNTKFNNSIRFHIPQVLNALYPIRNKRGVAHHAGEISPNHMDATFVVASVDWVMAELVRIFHSLSISEAQALVESLTVKQIPVIWEFGNHKRVLSPPGHKLNAREKVLLLLYSAYPNPLNAEDLLKWTEYANKTRFRSDLLKELHKSDLAHFDEAKNEVYLSLLGLKYVEDNLPLNF